MNQVDRDTILATACDVLQTEAEAILHIKERLNGELKKTESEIARAEGKLNNQGFVAKAPEAVVAAEREKLEKLKATKEAILEAIAKMN